LSGELSEKNNAPSAGLGPQEWLDAIPQPALLIEGGVAVIANDSALNLLGDPIGKQPSEWNPAFDATDYGANSGKGLENKTTIDGKEFIVRISPLGASPELQLWIFQPADEPVETASERERRLEKAVEIRTRMLKLAEDKYRHLFEKSSFGIVQLDPNGDWITTNPMFLEITGRAEDELPGLKFENLVHPKDKKSFKKKLKEWLAGGGKELYRCRIVRPGGASRHIVIWTQRLENEGLTVGLQLSMVDVTEETRQRLAAEAEKDHIRESLENIMRSMLEALVVVEPNGRIAQVNEAALKMLGWEEEELMGKPVGMLFAKGAENIAEETKKFAKLLKASIAKEVEVAWRRRDGSIVPVSFSASIMRDAKGKLAGIVAVARDQSENRLRRKFEEANKELEQALKELKVVDAAKDDLISMVGHELRGPLAGIRGFAEFLLEKTIGENERVGFAEKIVKEVDRLTRMVNDILDLAKMELGKMRYYMEPALMNDIAADCIERAQPVAGARDISFTTSFEECPPLVMDVDRLCQVIDNLLSNAIKFSPEGDEIEIVVSDHKHFVKVTVRDHGVGIPDNEKDAVFDKFEQTPDGRRAMVGTGLGMPISRSIIEDGHRGRIWFNSEGEGKGTTFFFTIPKNLKPTSL